MQNELGANNTRMRTSLLQSNLFVLHLTIALIVPLCAGDA